MIKGKCECGAVRYKVDTAIADYSHCHCAQCRRLHGAAFASFGGVPRDAFSYLAGEDSLKTYDSSTKNTRVFCGICGSNILVDSKPEPDVLYIALGTVDGEPELPPGYHQYVASKAPWYEMDDHLPCFEGSVDE